MRLDDRHCSHRLCFGKACHPAAFSHRATVCRTCPQTRAAELLVQGMRSLSRAQLRVSSGGGILDRCFPCMRVERVRDRLSVIVMKGCRGWLRRSSNALILLHHFALCQTEAQTPMCA